MPEIVVMKFRGDDAIRSGANQRFFDKGGFSLRSEDTDLIASTEDGVKLADKPPAGDHNGQAESVTPEETRRGLRAGGQPLSSRIRDVLSEIEQLAPAEPENLGLESQTI